MSMTMPTTRREWFVALICTVVASRAVARALIQWPTAFWGATVDGQMAWAAFTLPRACLPG